MKSRSKLAGKSPPALSVEELRNCKLRTGQSEIVNRLLGVRKVPDGLGKKKSHRIYNQN